MRYGSICSGVEAATLAWEPLGWEAAFFAEVEPFPCEVLRQKFGATRPLRVLDPEEAANDKDRKQRERWRKYINTMPEGGKIKNLGDFTKITKEDYEGDIDLLVGGFPCQDFSISGVRKGLDGSRGQLALEFARLAFRLKAKWFCGENVPGLLSQNHGKAFAVILSMFCGWDVEVPVLRRKKNGEVVRGWKNSGIVTGAPGCYGVAWRIIDAQYTRVDGFPRALPQRRRRVFLVGNLGGWERAAAVLFEPPVLLGNHPPQRKAGTGVARNLTASTGGASGKEQQLTFVDEYGIPLNALCMAHGQGGAEVMKNHAPTLSCNHEAPIVCRESGQGFWQEDKASGTVKVNGAEPTTVVCYDARGFGNGEVAPNITGDHASRANDYLPVVVEEPKGSFGFLPGQGAGAGSIGFEEELSPTLRSNCDSYGVLSYGIAENIINRQPQNGGTVRRSAEVTLQTPVAEAPCGSGNEKQKNTDISFGIAENIINRQPQNGGNGSGCSKDVQYTLNATGVHGVCCFTQNDAARDCTDNIAPTLRSGGIDGGAINQAIARHGTVRRLTPLEAERLMGFPDNHTLIEYNCKALLQCPDGPRYKACGNSFCINCVRWIGMRIQMVEDFYNE